MDFDFQSKDSKQSSLGIEMNQVQATNDLFSSTSVEPSSTNQFQQSTASLLNSKNELCELGNKLEDMGLSSRASSLASTHVANDDDIEKKQIKVSADSISYNQNSPCPFGCSNCGASFETIRELKRHILSGHCRKHFFTTGAMSAISTRSVESSRSHRSRYAQSLNDKREKCTTCDKMFQNKWLLRRHMKIHSGEKNFACEVCGKRFREKSDLKTHSVKHTNIQRYQCEHCGKKFKWNASYRYHKFQSKSCGKNRKSDDISTSN